MKKIKTILITLLFAGFSTFSYAEGKMGLTITGLDASGDAAEMSRGVEQTRSEDIQGVFATFFIEKDLGPMSVGLDINPMDIASGSVTNVRSGGGAFNNQTNTAEVEINDNIGLYGIMNLGGKGSDTHAAAVVGDTVGDPFKDTSGPAMNILINVMAIVSLVIAGLLPVDGLIVTLFN